MDTAKKERMTAAYDALTKQIHELAEKFERGSTEILAMCAFVTGVAVSVQDRRTLSVEMARDIISSSIAAGERAAQKKEGKCDV